MQQFFAKFNNGMKASAGGGPASQQPGVHHQARVQTANNAHGGGRNTQNHGALLNNGLVNSSNHPGRTENSFTRKLKEKRRAFQNQKL